MSNNRPDRLTWRHWVIGLAVLGAMVAVMWRLYDVQILSHESYLEQAAVSRQGAATIPAARGAILDSTGYPLATSVDTWDIYIDRFLWRDRERALTAARGMADFLQVSPDTLLTLGMDGNAGDVLVTRQVDYAHGLQLAEMELWGIRLIPSSRRIYPEGNLAGQLVGYVGRDGDGLWGVESDFNAMLQGRDGWTTIERDTMGRPIAFSQQRVREPVSGGEVQLTIDRFIQGMAEATLADALERYDAKSGSIIVMDPLTGEVLAMTSLPSITLNNVDLNHPELDSLVRNAAITDLYEPGSVMKTLTTAVAIDLGLVAPHSTFKDEGALEVGGYTIRNWDLRAYGEVTVSDYLRYSLNTAAVWLGEMIGPESFYKAVAAFGLGEPTHLGLSGEAEGAYRTPADPDWYPIDIATNSYGQGMAVTPLQMLTAWNSTINGGLLMRPYVVSRIVTANDVRNYEPVTVRRVLSETTSRVMLDMLHYVVHGGDWHGARVNGYEVAGKTGTTLVSIPTGYDIDSTIATFAGTIPYENPQVSILVKIDQPSGGLNLGGQVAAPIFADLASQIMDYLRIQPSSTRVATP